MCQKKRDKVVAEISAAYLVEFAKEAGNPVDRQEALIFLNEKGWAYGMWKAMMYAGESYIKSELSQAKAVGSGNTTKQTML